MRRSSILLIVACIVIGTLSWATWRYSGRLTPEKATEIAVFFPGTNERDWYDFIQAVRLAAKEEKLPVSVDADSSSCTIGVKPTPVTFQWYPDVGVRALKRRVKALCDQAQPPLALVGTNNSSLTRAIAEQLAESTAPNRPLLLMTNATADGLLVLNPGRSFRFGYRNSYQAEKVVERLQHFWQERQMPATKVNVLSVAVEDNPFAMDLAYRFEKELSGRFPANFAAPKYEQRPAQAEDPVVPRVPNNAFVLRTATGGFDDPNPDEWSLAARLVSEMANDPGNPWVLVLPVGTTPYRRIAYALSETFKNYPDAEKARQAQENLVILTGDSMNYYSFRDLQFNQLLPQETPAPVIFFDHVNPLDPTVLPTAHSSIPLRGLYREVVRTLVDVLPRLGNQPEPTALAHSLKEYTSPGEKEPLFRNFERCRGGGAILAIPRPAEQRFDLQLPSSWETAESRPPNNP